MKLNFTKHVLPVATILAAVVAMPAHAAYVCTGASTNADPSSPYFNGDLTDGGCDITEVEVALGLTAGTIDESLILGSKTNWDEPTNPGAWTQDQFALGMLTVEQSKIGNTTTGTWTLTGDSVVPLFFVDKYNGGYDIFTYMGGSTSPFSDSWDDSNRGFVGATCKQGNTGDVNCKAGTSHVSVYGVSVVPVPAAVWLFGSGLLGLIGIARRKKS